MGGEVREGVEAQYEGVSRAHWELAYLRVRLEGRRLFGLLPNTQTWWPRFPDGFELPWSSELGGKPADPLFTPRHFQMRLRAIPGPRGHYGHRGGCVREAHITQIL